LTNSNKLLKKCRDNRKDVDTDIELSSDGYNLIDKIDKVLKSQNWQKKNKEILENHKDNNSFQDWIIENKLKGNSEMDLIKDMNFASYPYNKYYDIYFSYKLPSGFNIICLFGDGSEKGYKVALIFKEQFSKRLVLILKYFKVKSMMKLNNF